MIKNLLTLREEADQLKICEAKVRVWLAHDRSPKVKRRPAMRMPIKALENSVRVNQPSAKDGRR